MSGRPIVLPELPEAWEWLCGVACWGVGDLQAYACAAVEADRRGIVVTHADYVAAKHAAGEFGDIELALESFAKRLRGETP